MHRAAFKEEKRCATRDFINNNRAKFLLGKDKSKDVANKANITLAASPPKDKNHIPIWRCLRCQFSNFGFRGCCMLCAELPPAGTQQRQEAVRQEAIQSSQTQQPNQKQFEMVDTKDTDPKDMAVTWDPYMTHGTREIEEQPPPKRNRWSAISPASKEMVGEALFWRKWICSSGAGLQRRPPVPVQEGHHGLRILGMAQVVPTAREVQRPHRR
ncbi:unnamed protein product [Prorocentrum cordatum]|uniref:RanBP2-type domain-containing protein n=1 Tax=Prorocentrum cordatum TaxID=2364126 RepID=A0ABN9TLQ9_9DINO|nr:unnamed protein product [Polarella glacialis]